MKYYKRLDKKVLEKLRILKGVRIHEKVFNIG